MKSLRSSLTPSLRSGPVHNGTGRGRCPRFAPPFYHLGHHAPCGCPKNSDLEPFPLGP